MDKENSNARNAILHIEVKKKRERRAEESNNAGLLMRKKEEMKSH